jgi:hypothetical protein
MGMLSCRRPERGINPSSQSACCQRRPAAALDLHQSPSHG